MSNPSKDEIICRIISDVITNYLNSPLDLVHVKMLLAGAFFDICCQVECKDKGPDQIAEHLIPKLSELERRCNVELLEILRECYGESKL